MAHAETPRRIRVEIAWSPRAGVIEHRALTVAAGASIGDALRQAGVVPPPGMEVAVWGRLLDAATALAAPLADRDRIEFHRPLAVDPNEARLRRARLQRQAGS